MKSFDVVGVNLISYKVRIMAAGLDEENADAYVTRAAMAVMQRGVKEEFFSSVPAGMYLDGEPWRGNGREAE